MAFTVADYGDLVRLLREHPEWKEELRREIFGEGSFAELRQAIAETDARIARLQERTDEGFARLTAAQERTDERIAALIAAQERTDQSIVALTAAQERTDERLAALTAAQERTDQRIAELATAQLRTEQRVSELDQRMAELATAQLRTEQRVSELDQRMAELAAAQQRTEAVLTAFMAAQEARNAEFDRRFDANAAEHRSILSDLADLRGWRLEEWFRNRPHRLQPELRRPASILVTEVIDIASLLGDGTISRAEGQALRDLDLLVSGRAGKADDSRPVYLAVEISGVINRGDVERARDRAAKLRRLGLEASAVVAGNRLASTARELAEHENVQVVTLEQD
jgi:hypothetical protein